MNRLLNRVCLIGLVSLVSCLVVSSAHSAFDCSAESDALCGPKCLLVICQQLGIETDLDELVRLSSTDETGTSLAGLYNAAKEKGLKAVGMKIGVEDLAKLEVPAVAHLWGNHFVVVENGGVDGLRITNPPGEAEIVSIEDFREVFSGFALLISQEDGLFPSIDAKGPDVRFDEYYCDLGVADEGQIIEHVLGFGNVGEEDLLISGARSSCACMEAETSEKTIPPDGRGEILISFDTTDLQSEQVKVLYVHSNDPISPLAQIEVGVFVKSSKVLLSPRRLDFGELKLREGAKREMYVKDPGDGSLMVKEVLPDSPFITATYAQIKDEKRTGYLVTVTLNPDLPAGEFTSAITLHTNHPKQPQIEVPITARIKSTIDCFPKTIFFGFVGKGMEKKATVTISADNARPLKIEKIDNPLDYVSIEASPQIRDKEYLIIVALKDTAPPGRIKSEIVIHLGDPDQPLLRVPVSGFVEDL
ncbi:MAG: DUF1573 domain-containing protein [Armatimonadetes bacterium]|nr:DUF1573 domain-containing protein [Armatimonadota bacterium]NIM24475.1 DUF1573 domain-containing protein [Armatimonadota bacterium]NIM68346.1 DUF1573 domain-containing protein [Armatimonadota bacterium]NIM76750.1 DUF1573 domain-containing protein [Armatimonadota bacterium]NIN06549.1 DUF1573 domain-containing protein [Armatimonadota bacterium]